jgi:hypothetical protein
VTDFDNVRFNQGDGWDEVVAIHLAIKERADATQHTLKDGAYADPWTTTPIWLGDPDGDPSRAYLNEILQQFYDDILLLIDGDAEIRWNEASGDTPEWTLASLVTDIDMGDWLDLLTNPANHEPFLWLHEALDRLIHWSMNLEPTDGGRTRKWSTSLQVTIQGAWDNRGEATYTPTSLPLRVVWNISDPFGLNNYTAIVFDDQQLVFATADFDGVVSEATYIYNTVWTNALLSDVDVAIGSQTINFSSAQTAQERTNTDFALGSDTTILLAFSTSEPATAPVSVPTGLSGTIELLVTSADLYIDLATILTDQAA